MATVRFLFLLLVTTGVESLILPLSDGLQIFGVEDYGYNFQRCTTVNINTAKDVEDIIS